MRRRISYVLFAGAVALVSAEALVGSPEVDAQTSCMGVPGACRCPAGLQLFNLTGAGGQYGFRCMPPGQFAPTCPIGLVMRGTTCYPAPTSPAPTPPPRPTAPPPPPPPPPPP